MGGQTALEPVCRRTSHETLVGVDDADSDGSDGGTFGMVSASRTFHDSIDLVHYHSILLGNTRYSGRWILYDRFERT